MLELPCWTDSKGSQQEIVLFEGMQESKPTYRDWNYDIIIVHKLFYSYIILQVFSLETCTNLSATTLESYICLLANII